MPTKPKQSLPAALVEHVQREYALRGKPISIELAAAITHIRRARKVTADLAEGRGRADWSDERRRRLETLHAEEMKQAHALLRERS